MKHAEVDATRIDFQAAVTKAGSLLPAQGPITSFAFLNPLEGLETLPFHEGLQRGAKLNGCEPYLPESKYRELLAAQRIDVSDLEASLRRELGESADELLVAHCTRFQLRMALLKSTFPTGHAEELEWVMAETDALVHCRTELQGSQRQVWLDEVRNWVMEATCAGRVPLTDLMSELGSFHIERITEWSDTDWQSVGLRLLWTVCQHGVESGKLEGEASPPSTRHREAVRLSCGVDSDRTVLQVLGPFCAAFIDQGLAQWRLPGRELGFLKSFANLYDDRFPTAWGRHSFVADTLRRVRGGELTATDLLRESMDDLGVGEAEVEDYVTASLLAFRGWAGMLWQMEVRPDRVPQPVPPGTLLEYLAVQLLLERWSIRETIPADSECRDLLQEGTEEVDLSKIRERVQGTNDVGRQPPQWAFKVFQLAQVLGWDIAKLAALTGGQWKKLLDEIAEFPVERRRQLFHSAYERHYRVEALDAFAAFCHRKAKRVENPSFQSMYCIDAREESFRRHVEEIDPRAETFGNAGFFNVPIYYRGAGDAHYTALCPVVVRAQHWVTEEVSLTMEDEHRRRSQARRVLGGLSHRVHQGSRGLAAGAVLSAGLGVLASVPLVMRILFPGMSAKLRRTADRFVSPPPSTRLRLERSAAQPGPTGAGIGLNLEEMVAMGERALRDTGLTSGYAPLVMIFGHGSSCLNNPHKSLYDCGACTGSAGGPNARALAYILNDRRVRSVLAERGIVIPNETAFLGGLHNTGQDTIVFYDLDLLPVHLRESFQEARNVLDLACERNARERSRRFYSIPLDVSPRQALRLVDERTEDLAQTRPEYGNCTNALCFVGRRSRVRGLFLDRRSFLMSYDHDQDDDSAMILGRILAAVVPVCSGINMQYTLSAMDVAGWGSGTKLPHNITSLLGVMDGAASDLRSGLPWQGTDIHEPMRLMFVMETTPERLQQVMSRFPVVERILKNGWAQLALLDPNSPQLLFYDHGEYRPYVSQRKTLPRVPTSADWYSGHREHLPFAVIDKGMRPDQEMFAETEGC
ncbi:MAG: DUF2309 domain-containing protein [Planctomycetaceae bacterium]